MKLRSLLPSQQLISRLVFTSVCLGAVIAHAQTDATVTYKVKPEQPEPVKIVSVNGGNLMVKDTFGERGIPMVQILEVRMAEPPEVRLAIQAFQAKDYAKAMAEAKIIADRFKGLPTNWAIAVSSLVGDIYLAQGDLPNAEIAYDAFAKAYPGSGGADLGKARIAVAKKDYDFAKKIAEPLRDKALNDKNVTQTEGQLYGQAFLVLGQVKEAQKDYQGALEDYLRTVTLFYYDPSAVSVAQDRADALRKAHSAFVP